MGEQNKWCPLCGDDEVCPGEHSLVEESEAEARTVSAIVAWLRTEVDRMCGRARGSLSAGEAAAWNRQASTYQQASDYIERGDWKKERAK